MNDYQGIRTAGGVRVTVNEAPLPPRLDLQCHAVTGFDWGSSSNGSAQLALALLAMEGDDQVALDHHMAFKEHTTDRLSPAGWTLNGRDIQEWLGRVASAGDEPERSHTADEASGCAIICLYRGDGGQIDRLVGKLIDAGYRADVARLESSATALGTIRWTDYDIVLVECVDGLDDLAHVVAHVDKRRLVTAVIGIAGRRHPQVLTRALGIGAKDFASYSEPDLLQRIVERERQVLLNRRELLELKHAYRAVADRREAAASGARPSAVIVAGRHVHANEAYLGYLGLASDTDLSVLDLADLVEGDVARLQRFVAESGKRSKTGSIIVPVRCADGPPRPTRLEVLQRDGSGEQRTTVTMSEVRAPENRYRDRHVVVHETNAEYLAGLLNCAISDALIVDVTGQLLLLDVGSIIAIQQALSESARGQLHQDVAALIVNQVRPADPLVRLSETRFALLLNATPAAGAEKVVDRIQEAFHHHVFEIEHYSFSLNCRIARAAIDPAAVEAATVIGQAARGLEMNRGLAAIVGEPEPAQPPAQPPAGEARLGLEHLSVVFQPIIACRPQHEQRRSFEVFLRGVDGDGKAVAPERIVAAAVDDNRVADLDTRVVQQACQSLEQHRSEGGDFRYFVKISAHSMVDDEVIKAVYKCIKRHGVRPDQLVVQISERAIVNLRDVQNFVRVLNRLGIPAALDHFGFGENSFALLDHLPVDFLKLDRTIMQNFDQRTHTDALKDLQAAARQLGKQTIATGVRDAKSLAAVWQCEFDFAQGYFIHPPSTRPAYDLS